VTEGAAERRRAWPMAVRLAEECAALTSARAVLRAPTNTMPALSVRGEGDG
jgi:hypothetical protein